METFANDENLTYSEKKYDVLYVRTGYRDAQQYKEIELNED